MRQPCCAPHSHDADGGGVSQPERSSSEEDLWSDSFEGTCTVCGSAGSFVRSERSIREGYRCPHCKAHLRYQGQALALLQRYGTETTQSLAELVEEPTFRDLDVYEPGTLGPLRQYLARRSSYTTSEYVADVPRGHPVGTGTCQDLMALTFADASFDLVVTSDVFEHVRHPYAGFAEVHRVLRTGGVHVFSIPVQYPLPARTVARVDVSGAEDVHLLEPQYHRHHLVYNDFGEDMVGELGKLGLDTEVLKFPCDSPHASRLATFVSVKV